MKGRCEKKCKCIMTNMKKSEEKMLERNKEKKKVKGWGGGEVIEARGLEKKMHERAQEQMN